MAIKSVVDFFGKEILKYSEAILGVIFWLAAIKFASTIVYKTNYSIGGWIIFIWVSAAILNKFRVPVFVGSYRARLAFIVSLMSFVALFFFILGNVDFGWKQLTRIDGVEIIKNSPTFWCLPENPSEVPLYGLNDDIEFNQNDSAHLEIIYRNTSTNEIGKEMSSSLAEACNARFCKPELAMPVLIVFIFLTAPGFFFLWKGLLDAYSFFKQNKLSMILADKHFLFILIELGLLRSILLFPPQMWLSNFMFSDDDWKYFEHGARMILQHLYFDRSGSTHLQMWSFIYYYYLAVMHFFLGDAVYPAIAISFGLSMILLWVLIEIIAKNCSRAGLVYLAPLSIAFLTFVEFDLHRYYTRIFLSDNLLLLLIALLVLELLTYKRPLRLGIIVGLIYLCRLELLPLVFIYLFYFLVFEGERRSALWKFLAGYVPIFIVYPLVSLLVGGNFYFFRDSFSTVTKFSEGFSTDFVNNFLILLGQYNWVLPEYHNRYHWYVIHLMLIAFVVLNFRKNFLDRKVIFLLLGTCLGILVIRSFACPGIYGFRYSLPVVLVEIYLTLLFAVKYVARSTLPVSNEGLV